MRFIAMLAGLSLFFAPLAASAHSGGTDKYGCHRESATGTRHCHSDQAEAEPVRLWQAALAAGVMSSLGVMTTWWGFANDDNAPLRILAPSLSLALAVGSQVTIYVLGERAGEESDEDPTAAIYVFWAVNGAIVLVDILIMAGVTALRHDSRSAAIDLTGGQLSWSVPRIALDPSGAVVVPALIGATF